MNFHSEDRTYARYFQEVAQAKMPANAREERELFERYHETGDTNARQRIVEGGLRFVVKTAKQYYRGDAEFFKTLIAAGNVGLMVAVDRYKPWVIRCPRCNTTNFVATAKRQRCKACNRALRSWEAKSYTTRFLTYAAWWINEAIRSELYDSTLVHIPAYKQKEMHRQRKNGKNVGFTYIPFDETPEQFVIDNEAEITNVHVKRLLHQLLSAMNPRHAYVLITYFGLREDPKTFREIAQKLEVCPERVRQIKVEAMQELRKKLLSHRITQTRDLYLPN
jgi:RNA polymerase sigma factor (sigma-70 family)